MMWDTKSSAPARDEITYNCRVISSRLGELNFTYKHRGHTYKLLTPSGAASLGHIACLSFGGGLLLVSRYVGVSLGLICCQGNPSIANHRYARIDGLRVGVGQPSGN
jgi:hypothetical protein